MIVKTPGTCGGEARIDGTRIPVWLVVKNNDFGGVDAVLEAYPHLTREQVEEALQYAKDNKKEIKRDMT